MVPEFGLGKWRTAALSCQRGKKIILTSENTVGTPAKIAVSFKGLHRDVAPGTIVLLDDGNIELQVLEIKAAGDVVCDIVRGGELKSNKGVNLKNRLVSLPSLTTKDYQDLDFAVSEELDFLALSFVQSSSDVRFLKQALAERGASIPVIAKIERKNALDDIKNIVRECYGVMVARGDLALEMSFEDVPIAQKRIITVCRDEGVPVITATQMLESMINFHKPTRAEAADIANAILDGSDAVMLSAESAVGRFPVEAVATMATIAATGRRVMDHRGTANSAIDSGSGRPGGCGSACGTCHCKLGDRPKRLSLPRPPEVLLGELHAIGLKCRSSRSVLQRRCVADWL